MAHASVSGYTCPPVDEAGFSLGQSDTTANPIFCSYPAFQNEYPNDFFCTYSATDGTLVEDHNAGFCPPSAVFTGTTTVTPTPPTFVNLGCQNGIQVQESLTIPLDAGVDYYVNGVLTASGTYSPPNPMVIVTTQAQNGYMLSGTTTFTHTYPAVIICGPSTTTLSVSPPTQASAWDRGDADGDRDRGVRGGFRAVL